MPYRTPSWKDHTWPMYHVYHASYIGERARVRAAKYGFALLDWEPAVITALQLDPASGMLRLGLKGGAETRKAWAIRFRSKRTPVLARPEPDVSIVAVGDGLYELRMPASAAERNIDIRLQ